MIRESNLIDLSKITLENYTTYNEHIKYEIPRQWGVTNRKPKRKKCKTEEERKQYIKEYQHNYYMRVTKRKRKEREI